MTYFDELYAYDSCNRKVYSFPLTFFQPKQEKGFEKRNLTAYCWANNVWDTSSIRVQQAAAKYTPKVIQNTPGRFKIVGTGIRGSSSQAGTIQVIHPSNRVFEISAENLVELIGKYNIINLEIDADLVLLRNKNNATFILGEKPVVENTVDSKESVETLSKTKKKAKAQIELKQNTQGTTWAFVRRIKRHFFVIDFSSDMKKLIVHRQNSGFIMAQALLDKKLKIKKIEDIQTARGEFHLESRLDTSDQTPNFTHSEIIESIINSGSKDTYVPHLHPKYYIGYRRGLPSELCRSNSMPFITLTCITPSKFSDDDLLKDILNKIHSSTIEEKSYTYNKVDLSMWFRVIHNITDIEWGYKK